MTQISKKGTIEMLTNNKCLKTEINNHYNNTNINNKTNNNNNKIPPPNKDIKRK